MVFDHRPVRAVKWRVSYVVGRLLFPLDIATFNPARKRDLKKSVGIAKQSADGDFFGRFFYYLLFHSGLSKLIKLSSSPAAILIGIPL